VGVWVVGLLGGWAQRGPAGSSVGGSVSVWCTVAACGSPNEPLPVLNMAVALALACGVVPVDLQWLVDCTSAPHDGPVPCPPACPACPPLLLSAARCLPACGSLIATTGAARASQAPAVWAGILCRSVRRSTQQTSPQSQQAWQAWHALQQGHRAAVVSSELLPPIPSQPLPSLLDTMQWLVDTAAELPRVPSVAFVHIPIPQVSAASSLATLC